MFTWLPYIYNFFSKKNYVLSKISSLLAIKRDKKLIADNKALKLSNEEKDKIIAIQDEVSDVTCKTKPTNIDGVVKRMRRNKL